MTGPAAAGRCPACGAPFADLDACEAAFRGLLERDFSGFAPYAIHRLAVDAYSLQHPDRYMKSAKSAAAHLTGIVHALEYGGSPRVGRALQRWLNGSVDLARPEPPPLGARGEVTLAHVLEAPDPGEHEARVERWARSAWGAWAPHQTTACGWVEEALEKGP